MKQQMKLLSCIAFIALSFACPVFTLSISAQRSQVYHDNEKTLKDAIDLFQKQKYGAAQDLFRQVLASPVQLTEYAKADASYYNAACGVELFHDNAEYLMKHFISTYPESPKMVQAHFQLAKLYFRKKEYGNAVNELLASDVFQLSKEQYFEYYYKLGYSRFMTGQLDQALKSFSEVKDRKNPYQVPATYYYGHISYLQKNYAVAQQHFLLIKDDKNFSKIVPFYIAQIYFIQKKYDEAIAYAEPIADTLKGKNTGVIRRIMAEAYFETKDYEKAAANYEAFVTAGNTLDREGNYRIGLSYYFLKRYTDAAAYLKNATSEEDAISQSAYYYLADCFIKTGDKRLALDALKLSYTLEFDKKIAKESMYNFAKLSYELGYNPYNEAIDALQKYIEKYPDAENKEDAYELLVKIYLQVNNYKDALVSLDKITVKNTALKFAEQRIYLFRGIELFNNVDYTLAITHFETCIEKNYDHKVSSEARFWMADAFYRMKNYDRSISALETYLVSPSSKGTENYRDAYYNLGYAKFKTKNYSAALSEFKIFTEQSSRDQRKLNDAYLRIGDCYFMARNYERSMEFYDKAIAINKIQSDYALFQKGMIQGLSGNHAGKLASLERALREHPNSLFRDEIYYEAGLANVRLSKSNDAITAFQNIVTKHPQSPFVSRSFLQLGLIYYNSGNSKEALTWYKRAVDEYPNTTHSNEALKYIRSIYIELGDIDTYTAYMSGLGQDVNVSQGSIDSASYEAAEVVINAGNCAQSIEVLHKYLSNFPKGIFALEAHHQKAECHLSRKEYTDALEDYNFIIEQRSNEYRENALLRSGEICVYKKDSACVQRIYTEVEKIASNSANLQVARTELMRSWFKLRNYEQAIGYATMVLTFDKLSARTDEEANYIIASSNYELQRMDDALVYYKKLQGKTSSEYFAEAAYRCGEIMFGKGNAKDAEKLLRGSVKNMGSSKVWLAKTFILLGDIYVSIGNMLEAKSVYQTVIDKHDGQDLIDIAKQRLEAIQEQERQKNNPVPGDGMEFDMQQGKPDKTNNGSDIRN